jgi:hypothetical protein
MCRVCFKSKSLIAVRIHTHTFTKWKGFMKPHLHEHAWCRLALAQKWEVNIRKYLFGCNKDCRCLATMQIISQTGWGRGGAVHLRHRYVPNSN